MIYINYTGIWWADSDSEHVNMVSSSSPPLQVIIINIYLPAMHIGQPIAYHVT